MGGSRGGAGRVPSHLGWAGVLSPSGGRDDTPMLGFLSPLAEGSRGRAAAALVVGLLGGLAPSMGRAEPRPLKDNRFSLDLFQGPILAPISVTGIAGAYAGYAEGIAGMVA